MSKYFIPYIKEEQDPTYPEDVRYIRAEISALYGTLDCSNKKLGELWRDFSDRFDAGFLNPNAELIEEFVEWLDIHDD